MPARRKRDGRGSTLWLSMAFLLLLLVSLALRYGETMRSILPARGPGRELRGNSPTRRDPVARSREHAAGPRDERGLRLQVLNATGVNRLALQVGESLRSWGVDVLDRGNAPAWPFPETLLLVRETGSERHAEVAKLAKRLGDMPVILQRRGDLVLDATLVLGHDWEDYDWPEP